jgi:hypothetical protein
MTDFRLAVREATDLQLNLDHPGVEAISSRDVNAGHAALEDRSINRVGVTSF